MATKAEKAEAIQTLKDALKDCSPKGHSTLEIRWVGGVPTSTGRSDYYELHVWSVQDVHGKGDHRGKRPRPMWSPTWSCHIAGGYRWNKAREALMVGGCGYNKAHAIAEHLADLVGHAIYVEGSGSGGDGWHEPRHPRKAAK